nr:RNA-directed DNA polymerase, eukaryota [Tanacetum cinerariifolium]
MGSYRSKEDDVSKTSTSIFVTNFPESFSAKDLFNSCKQYGHIVDSFIPSKRSKSGKRFGFVRFINVFNKERLVNNLCTVLVNRFKLHANIARFNRAPMKDQNIHVNKEGGTLRKDSKMPGNDNGTKVYSNTYVQAVKGVEIGGSKAGDIEVESSPELVVDEECLYSKDMDHGFLYYNKCLLILRLKEDLNESKLRESPLNCDVDFKGGDPVGHEDGGNGEDSDVDKVPETRFDVSSGQKENQSDDPFEIYLLLNKHRQEKSQEHTVNDDSLKYPSGFTPNEEAETVGQPNEKGESLCGGSNHNDNVEESYISPVDVSQKKDSKDNDSYSGCSGRFKKSKIPRTGGSILCLMEELVTVGQTMGYNIEGCVKDMTDIIESQGDCPNICAVTLDRFLSDHRPILLRESKYDYGPTPFSFYHHWMEVDGFSDFVNDTWRVAPGDQSNGMRNLAFKLKFLKTKIREWTSELNNKSKGEMNRLKDELIEVDAVIDKGNASDENIRKRSGIINSMVSMNNIKMSEAAQKAKIKWSVEGDENSRFFHGMLNKKRSQLRDIVSEVQSAFIADRQILDGPFILNEVMHWCKVKKKQSLIFKVDFEKAYDSVRWDFLDEVLLKFGFGNAGMFTGINLNSSLTLSHMFYADDAVFLGQWNDENIDILVNVLECFHRVSGLKINMSKIGGKMSREQEWNEVVKKVKSWLSKWKLKALSIGELVKSEFLQHFSKRFGKPQEDRASISMNFPNVLSNEQAEDLECDVTNEEVKRAVWDYGTDKSPGPDGFTFGCNSSFIALIPKVPGANMVKDFRPISLIVCIYKIIAKIMANRLVGVLGDIVSEVQSAFIADRQILDGPFILNEVMHWCKVKKKQSLIFKVDFEKAYDSVRWDFLDKGDPLLPLLFILVMESLHLSLQRVVDAGMFTGINLNSSLTLSHMFYADDAVFLGQWNDGNIDILVNVLECFHRVSGLKINMSKSTIMGIHVERDLVKHAAFKLGCLTLNTLFRLGTKVGGKMSRAQE